MGSFTELIQYLEQADINATLFINSLNFPWMDAVWSFFSNRMMWIPLYLVVLFFLFQRLGWKKGFLALLAVVLSILATDQLSNFIKDLVCRLRPCYDLLMLDGGLHVLEPKGGHYGFFSAHAANAVAFAVCTYRCFSWHPHITFRIYGSVMVLWAFLVGISRVFVGKHFLGDVLVGFAAGLIIALVVSGLLGLLARGRTNRR